MKGKGTIEKPGKNVLNTDYYNQVQVTFISLYYSWSKNALQ